MANEFVLKVATPSTANASSYASGSWTPTANRPYLAAVVLSRGSSTDPVTPTLSGNNITWALTDATEGNNLFGSSGTIRHRLLLFKGVANGSPTTGATTVDCGGVGHTGCGIIISEGDANIDTTTFVVQTDKAAGTGLSAIDAALAAFANAANYTYACFGANEADVFTHEGTELADINYSNPSTTLMAQFLASADTTPGATFPGPDTLGVIAVEVAIAAGGDDHEQPVDDTVSSTDAQTFDRGLLTAETVSSADALKFDRGLLVAETVTTADAQAFDRSILVEDTVTVADEATPEEGTGANLTQDVDDTVSSADALTFDRGMLTAETVSSADALTFDRGMVVADTVSLVEALAFSRGMLLADTVTVADDVDTVNGVLELVLLHFDQPSPSGGTDEGTPGASHFDQPTPGVVVA